LSEKRKAEKKRGGGRAPEPEPEPEKAPAPAKPPGKIMMDSAFTKSTSNDISNEQDRPTSSQVKWVPPHLRGAAQQDQENAGSADQAWGDE